MVPGNKKPLDEKLSQFVFVQFCIFIIEMSQCLPSGEEWIFHLVPDRQELGVDIDFPSGSNFVTDQTRLTFSLLNYLSLSLSVPVRYSGTALDTGRLRPVLERGIQRNAVS